MYEELLKEKAPFKKKSIDEGWFLDEMCPYKYQHWNRKLWHYLWEYLKTVDVNIYVVAFQLTIVTISDDILQRVPGLYEGFIYKASELETLICDICCHQKLYTKIKYRHETRRCSPYEPGPEFEVPFDIQIEHQRRSSSEDRIASRKWAIENSLKVLKSSNYYLNDFARASNLIQKQVDHLYGIQDSDYSEYVAEINERIERTLANRLQAGIRAWTHALEGTRQNLDDDGLGGDPKITMICTEIKITNQKVHVSPSIEEARDNLMQQLLSWQNIFLAVKHINSTRPRIGEDRTPTVPFDNVLNMMPDGSKILETAYKAIEDKIIQMQDHIQQWLAYQPFWDLQPDKLIEGLGNDVSLWVNKLIEIKNSRAAFATSEAGEHIRPIIDDCASVENKMTLPYDPQHKFEVMSKFSNLLNNEITELHGEITKARNDLELQSAESANTKDAVSFINYVQSLKTKSKQWESQVEVFRLCQQSLERQGFQFPLSWLYVDNLESELNAFNEIILTLNRIDSTPLPEGEQSTYCSMM